jgi:hypothetical protein
MATQASARAGHTTRSAAQGRDAAIRTAIRNFIQAQCITRREKHYDRTGRSETAVLKFLLWCLLLVLCWPVALVALVLYPLIWLLLLPFRIVGIAVGGVLELLWAVVTLPARLLRHA